MICLFNLSAGSVLLLDEANNSTDVAINMDAVERERYTTQMQLIEQDVSAKMEAGSPSSYSPSHRLVHIHRIPNCNNNYLGTVHFCCAKFYLLYVSQVVRLPR